MRAVSVQIAVNLVGAVESPGSPPAEFLVIDINARVDNVCGDARASRGVVVVGPELAIGGMGDTWEAPGGSIALADDGEGSHFVVLFDEVHLETMLADCSCHNNTRKLTSGLIRIFSMVVWSKAPA